MKVLKKYQQGGAPQPQCPVPTVDVQLNDQNRQSAMSNPDVAYSNTEGVAERSCANCAVFDNSPRMQTCNADIPSVGLCWKFQFKCESTGICSQHEEGGPIDSDEKSYETQAALEQQEAQEQQMQAQQQGPPQQGPPPEMMQQVPPQQPQIPMAQMGGQYNNYSGGMRNPYRPNLPYGLAPGAGSYVNMYEGANAFSNLFNSVGSLAGNWNKSRKTPPKSAYQKHTITNAPEGYQYNPNAPDIDSPGTFDKWKSKYMKGKGRLDKAFKKTGFGGVDEYIDDTEDLIGGDLAFYKTDLVKKRNGKRTSFGQDKQGRGGYGQDTPEGTTWAMDLHGEETSYAPNQNPYMSSYKDPNITMSQIMGVPRIEFQPGGEQPQYQASQKPAWDTGEIDWSNPRKVDKAINKGNLTYNQMMQNTEYMSVLGGGLPTADNSAVTGTYRGRMENTVQGQNVSSRNDYTSSDVVVDSYKDLTGKINPALNDTSYQYMEGSRIGSGDPSGRSVFYNTALGTGHINDNAYSSRPIPSDSIPYWKNKIATESGFQQYGGEQLPKAQMGLGGRKYEWWDDPNKDIDNPFGFPDEEENEDDTIMTHDSSWGDTFGEKLTNKANYALDKISPVTDQFDNLYGGMKVMNDLMNVGTWQDKQKALQQETMADNSFSAIQGNRGDWDVNSGIFRPDDKVISREDTGYAQEGTEVSNNPMWQETLSKYQRSLDFELDEDEREQARLDYIKHKKALAAQRQGDLIQQVEKYVLTMQGAEPVQPARAPLYRGGGEVEVDDRLLRELIAAGADIEIL